MVCYSFFHSLFFLLSLTSSFLSFSFHFLFILLFYSIPFILLSFFLFHPFLPIITFSVPFSYHPISLFLSIFVPFPFSLTFFSPFSFSLFFFSTFKTTRFKNDSLEVHKGLYTVSVSHLRLLLSGSWQK